MYFYVSGEIKYYMPQKMTLPDHVGYLMEPGSWLILEIHFDNPDGTKQIVESGVVVTYTDEIR